LKESLRKEEYEGLNKWRIYSSLGNPYLKQRDTTQAVQSLRLALKEDASDQINKGLQRRLDALQATQ